MKIVTPKTSGFAPGRKIFLGEDVSVSLDSELPEGYDFGFEANEDTDYAVRLKDGAYLIRPGSFSQWRYLTGASPYRRNYIDIDYTFDENNVFQTYSDYESPNIFSDTYAVMVNRGEYDYLYYSDIPDKVVCMKGSEEIWSYSSTGRNTSVRIALFMENYIVFPTVTDNGNSTYDSGITILDYEGNVVYENYNYLGSYGNVNTATVDLLHHMGGDTFYYENRGPSTHRILRVENNTLELVSVPEISIYEWFGNNYVQSSASGTYYMGSFGNGLRKISNETGEVIWENDDIGGMYLFVLNPYNNNLLIGLYYGTTDGWVTNDSDGRPRLLEVDGETGEILNNYVDEAADPDNSLTQHGCFLDEKTFFYYDNRGDELEVLELTFFDVETWTVSKKETISGYTTNQVVRSLPLHFRNGVAVFPVFRLSDNSSSVLVFVNKEGLIDIVVDESENIDIYMAPPTCAFDGRILFSDGINNSRFISYGPAMPPASLIVISYDLWNVNTLIMVDFGENIQIEDISGITLSGTVSGNVTPLTVVALDNNLRIENLTPTVGEALTLTIPAGSLSGADSGHVLPETLVLTLEVV